MPQLRDLYPDVKFRVWTLAWIRRLHSVLVCICRCMPSTRLRCYRANSVYYEAFFNESGPGVGPIPWTHKRGPSYWDGRLREHWTARGVNVTEDYLKVTRMLAM